LEGVVSAGGGHGDCTDGGTGAAGSSATASPLDSQPASTNSPA